MSERKKIIRIPVMNEAATRKCPTCNFTLFKHDWPMHSISLMLYQPFCPSCGQELDWENPVTVGGAE